MRGIRSSLSQPVARVRSAIRRRRVAAPRAIKTALGPHSRTNASRTSSRPRRARCGGGFANDAVTTAIDRTTERDVSTGACGILCR